MKGVGVLASKRWKYFSWVELAVGYVPEFYDSLLLLHVSTVRHLYMRLISGRQFDSNANIREFEVD